MKQFGVKMFFPLIRVWHLPFSSSSNLFTSTLLPQTFVRYVYSQLFILFRKKEYSIWNIWFISIFLLHSFYSNKKKKKPIRKKKNICFRKSQFWIINSGLHSIKKRKKKLIETECIRIWIAWVLALEYASP